MNIIVSVLMLIKYKYNGYSDNDCNRNDIDINGGDN